MYQIINTTTIRYATKEYNLTSTTYENPLKHIFAGNLLLATVSGSTTTATITYIHPDHLLGSSVYTTATTTEIGFTDYDPYGTIRYNSQPSPTREQRMFAGSEFDTPTGYNYLNARYYLSVKGQMVSEDPVFIQASFDLADPQGLNSYAYARNNPLRYTDPTGQTSLDYVAATAGYGVGFVQGVAQANVAFFNAAIHPVQTAMNTGRLLADGVKSGSELIGDLHTNYDRTVQEISSGISISFDEFSSKSAFDQGKAIGNIFGQIEVAAATASGMSKVASSATAESATPNFIVAPGGTVYPVPKGAGGIVSVINDSGAKTGAAYVGGNGGANGQVAKMRIMNPTPAVGNAPAYPNGYIKYENSSGQGVNPYSGKTVSKSEAHHPL